MDAKNPSQIFRIDAKGVFLEVRSDSFGDKERVHLGFFQYDEKQEKGSRFTSFVNIYLEFGTALALAEEILSGRMFNRAQVSAEEAGSDFPKKIYESLSGISAEKLAKITPRPDGKALSKQFTIYPGKKEPLMFVAQSGPGEKFGKGLIKPIPGSKPENRVSITISYKSAMEFAAILKVHIQAYIASQYTAGAYAITSDYRKTS